MRAQRLMTTPVATCHADDTLDHAAHLMWEHDYGAIPVVSANGVLIGIITDRDIAMSAYTQGKSLRGIRVSTAMATEVFSVSSSASVEEIEALMSGKKVRRVPVVDDDGRPVGLISLNDIARHANDGKTSATGDRKIVETLARICAPRGRAVTKREAPAAQIRA